MERQTMTAKEGAAFLGIPLRTFYERVRKHEIPVIRNGQRILCRKHTLQKWMDEMEQASVQKPEPENKFGITRIDL